MARQTLKDQLHLKKAECEHLRERLEAHQKATEEHFKKHNSEKYADHKVIHKLKKINKELYSCLSKRDRYIERILARMEAIQSLMNVDQETYNTYINAPNIDDLKQNWDSELRCIEEDKQGGYIPKSEFGGY